jgi:hypothetical protein
MCDPAFAARFEEASGAWDVALQIAALRQRAGISQKDLARRLKTYPAIGCEQQRREDAKKELGIVFRPLLPSST